LLPTGGAGIGTTSRVPRSTPNLGRQARNASRAARRSMQGPRPSARERWHPSCTLGGKTIPRKVVKISLLGESRSPWVPESAFEQPSPKLLRRP
jgi:hypothetical protein